MLLLRLMGLDGKVRVADGAAAAIPDATTAAPSKGAELIIAQALQRRSAAAARRLPRSPDRHGERHPDRARDHPTATSG